MYTTYILVSVTRGKYYTGHTKGLEKRLHEHNSGQTKSIRYGIPWQVIWTEEFPTRAEAMKKEIQIKNRGIARFLESVKITKPLEHQSRLTRGASSAKVESPTLLMG